MKYLLVFLCCSAVFLTRHTSAQETQSLKDIINQDELGNVNDEFQELFFKAIKQRAIENYDQAIETLNKCLALKETEPTIFVELGKNYIELEQLEKAENFLLEAINLLEDQQKTETQLLLFDVLKSQKKYKSAAELAQTLILKGEDLELDAIETYMLMENYTKALQEIEKLEAKTGYAVITDNFRDAIYKTNKNYKAAITHYQNRIDKNPLDEESYFRLINFFKFQGNSKAILETAKALEKINPLLDELAFILSIVYLEQNNPEEAFAYSQKVFLNNSLDEQVKTQLIQALKKFVASNPAYQAQFLDLLNIAIEEGESTASNQERAEFYLSRDTTKALEYYQKALIDQPGSFELHQKNIVIQLELNRFQNALTSIENAIEFFPMQAVFYFYKGKALQGLTQYDEAIVVLKEGLDYLFETSQLEVDLLELLAKVQAQNGNTTEADTFKKKAVNAKQKLDKME